MRLADFILANVDPILSEWEKFARSLAPGSAMSVIALRDHAAIILRVTARDMVTPQTSEEQSSKSKGEGGNGGHSDRLDHASEDHAIDRLGSGFNLIEVVSEYRALRTSVLQLWRQSVHAADERDLEDLTRFNESMDQSLAEAVRSYTGRVDESRELFLATLGHDLRSPLHAIMLSAQVLARSGQLDEENVEIASRIKVFGNTMSTMIHDLLDFTRTRLGSGIPVTVAPVDLVVLCQGVLDEFRAAHAGRSLRFTPDGDVRGQWDAARLRQVLSNLIANALAHGDENSEVEVATTGAGPDVLLSVKNRGPAIPPTALPTIFDPFVQAATEEPSTNRRAAGLGLGLFIAREIVTAHGGAISVASSDAGGTVFSVRLPRKPAAEAAAANG